MLFASLRLSKTKFWKRKEKLKREKEETLPTTLPPRLVRTFQVHPPPGKQGKEWQCAMKQNQLSEDRVFILSLLLKTEIISPANL